MTQPRRWIVGIAALLFVAAPASELTHVKSGTLSLTSLRGKQAECSKHGLVVPGATGPIQLFKIRYGSVDIHGVATTLSGLLILPKSAPKGLVVYYHGTIRDRERAPSRYTGWNKYPESEYVMMAFASGGYAVVMPDGLGLGDNLGVHPYPCGEANSRSGIDMIGPGRAVAKLAGVEIGKHLYLAGYSEGGAIAMCAARELERNPAYQTSGFHVDMAAPMSGPYDLSGETARSLLEGKQSAERVGTKLFLLSYAAYSASSNLKDIDLKDYFAPSFATYIPYVFGLKLDEVGMAKKLFVKAVQMGAIGSIGKVLTQTFRDSIKWSDPANPIIAEMMKSDCYNWTPRTKMLLPYLKGDGVVDDANTLKAIDSMRLNGVGPARLQSFEIDDRKLSHSTAAPIAFSAARRFFDGGFAGVWAGQTHRG